MFIIACKSQHTLTDTDELLITPAISPSTIVVARVNGAPILKEDLEEQMRSGQDRTQALRALIQAELLAQEALKRGFLSHPFVIAEQKRSLTHLFIRREITEKYTVKNIPKEMVEASYNLNIRMFKRPPLVFISHIVVIARAKHPPEIHERAKQLAERARQIAISGPLTEAEFKDIAVFLSKEAPGMQIKAESLHTPQRGFTVPEFADAAFALSKPGQISPVVKTPFGYHVIYLKEHLPGIDKPLSEVEHEVREKILDEARNHAFLKWADRLEKNYNIQILSDSLTHANIE